MSDFSSANFSSAKSAFLASVDTDEHMFAETLAFVEAWYDFTPTAFRNGDVPNQIDQNQGSAKVFALSQLLEMSKEQTLGCFGEHYRDVLATPEVDNHHNLRRVLREGNGNIEFDQFPLQAKA
jgi:hypothetical protein